MQKYYDVIIIGGGVVGSSIARELSRYHIKVCVLEKEADVCCGNSGRNTGMLHAGILDKPGTLKAKYAVEGNKAFDMLADELDVPFRRTGKLIVGFSEDQKKSLYKIKEQGDLNGVPGLSIIGQEQIREIEPNGGGKFALFSPTSGILCPHLYTIALAENAKTNGVDYYLEHEVKIIKKQKDGTYVITASDCSFYTKWIINSSGLNAPVIAAMLNSPDHVYKLVKGEYLLLDKRAGEYLNVPVYPAPDEYGICGIHATPTIDGNILIGPTCDEIVQTDNFDTTRTGLDALLVSGVLLFKEMKPEWCIRSYAGIFPRLIDPQTEEELDFLIEHKKETPNIINLIGMNTPGLTCAYPIGKHVAEIISKKESLSKNERFDPQRKGIIRFAEKDIETKQRMIRENPDYGEIVCRCECVTKAEILAALNNPLGVCSVNSIKYRTRAMMGRCQGGYCETRITSILQEHKGLSKTQIRLDSNESYMFAGEVRFSCN